MLKLLLLFITLSFVYGHSNKRSNDADLQSELMPQELNPFFVPADSLTSLPVALRMRRNPEMVAMPEANTMQQVKMYSRIVAGVVLAISATIEIVAYILEEYMRV